MWEKGASKRSKQMSFQIVIEIAADCPGVTRYVLPTLYETHQLARYLADREVQVNCADGAYVRQTGDVSFSHEACFGPSYNVFD